MGLEPTTNKAKQHSTPKVVTFPRKNELPQVGREGRKKEASKVKQTNKAKQHSTPKAVTFPRKNELPQVGHEPTTNKAKQHSTPKAVTFPRKNELPQVGLEPTTLYTLDRALCQLSYRVSSAGWAQISHLIVHLMNRLTINSV